MKDHRMTADYQRSVDDFVSRHLNGCASYLIQRLCELEEDEASNANIFWRYDEQEDGDIYMMEALEFWIVSHGLGRWLSERGELVDEVCGLTIWGRTTSGQAISMDGVICDIYDGLFREAA